MTCSKTVRLAWLVASMMFVVVGCVPPATLVPVKGVVLLDGKPLTGGVVTFQPTVGQQATSEIAPDGSFSLTRNAANDGVPPGTYRVAVLAYDPAADVQSVENLTVPVKYTRCGSSGLEFTVFPGTTDPVMIHLSSDIEAAAQRPTTIQDSADPASSTPSSPGGDRAPSDAAAGGG